PDPATRGDAAGRSLFHRQQRPAARRHGRSGPGHGDSGGHQRPLPGYRNQVPLPALAPLRAGARMTGTLRLLCLLLAAIPLAAQETPAPGGGPSIPREKGYLVQEIGGGLYWVTDGAYNTMFLVTGEGVVAVDAPPTLGANYLKAISEV